MKELFAGYLQTVTTLTEVRVGVVRCFEELKSGQNINQIGYVAGIITSDGREHIERNLRYLGEHTERIRQARTFPIFSAIDIFSQEVFERTNGFSLPPEMWLTFWRDVLGSGHVTDIFMTPRWETSRGAQDEHETAKKYGITIYYIEDNLS